ncbi:MAG: hypothetical protein M3209_09175 [Acidobacteriota bacterium]|nr:hypothetical protein [Acidobacteriota bacterium]
MITRRKLLFLLSSAGLTAGAPQIANAAPQPKPAARLASSNENHLYLEDFGGIADGSTDNSAALNAALNALKSTNGGTIVFPNGITKLTGSATVNMLGKQGAVRLVGSGGNSVVHVATGTEAAIRVGNTSRVNVEDITFIGTFRNSYNNDLFDCAQSVIQCSFVQQVTVRDCKFLGIAIGAPYDEAWNSFASNRNHGVVSVHEGDLLVERCYFGGCATSQCPNVNVDSWYGLTIRDSQFIDYGYYNDQTVTKTGYVTNTAWVRAINPKPVANAHTRGKIRIERTMFDEGCVYGLLAYGAQWVDIDNLTMNNGIGYGIALYNVAHTRIKDSFIGYTNSNVGVFAYNSKIIELDSLLFGGNVKYVQLEAGVSKLISRYSTLPGGSLYPNGIINRAGAALEIIK